MPSIPSPTTIEAVAAADDRRQAGPSWDRSDLHRSAAVPQRASAIDEPGETTRAIERVVRLLVDGRRSDGSLAVLSKPHPGPGRSLAAPAQVRSFREPLLATERAGPAPAAFVSRLAPGVGVGDRDPAAPAPHSTCHRGTSCPS